MTVSGDIVGLSEDSMAQGISELYYKLRELTGVLESVVTNLRTQDFYTANVTLRDSMAEIEAVLCAALAEQAYLDESGVAVTQEGIVGMLQSLMQAMEQKEYVLLADVLEQSVLQFLYRVQEAIVVRELAEPQVFSENGRTYSVEYTSSGLATVCVTERGENAGFYLHSNRNAQTEARLLAETWYRPEAERYLVFGMGLGYVVRELLKMSEYCNIAVFESDSVLIDLAGKFGCLEEIMATGRVSIVADEQASAFSEAVKKADSHDEVCFFYPSVRLVKDIALRERLEDTFINQSSQRVQYGALYGNFVRNSKNYDASITELKGKFDGKRVYLVAAGPSLDKNIEELKKVGDKDIIVAAGTVLKKLLREGIRVDFVAFTDAKAPTFVQVEGIEECGVPIFGLSTAYYRFFTDYKAKHYLMCQEGFEPAEKLAKENDWPLVKTGGSVITAALSAVLTLGAAEVVFVGLDLAFTGGKDHAEGTDFAAEKLHSEQRTVTDIYGKPVPTGKNLDIYRRFIEKIIRENRNVHFIDATEGGARVEGTDLAELRRVVEAAK